MNKELQGPIPPATLSVSRNKAPGAITRDIHFFQSNNAPPAFSAKDK